MIAVSFALDLYGSTDHTHLLLFTPVAALAGLAVFALAMILLNGGLNGGEMAGWRTALRRAPSPGGPSVGVDPTPATGLDADGPSAGQGPFEDGVGVEESEDVESTAITANLP
jgi:hypothetical protein